MSRWDSIVGKIVVFDNTDTIDNYLLDEPVAARKIDPQRLANWIAAPTIIRPDFPEMPPQNYLDDETRLAVEK